MHAAAGGGVWCLSLYPSVSVCWFRHLVFIASGVPANIVGGWRLVYGGAGACVLCMATDIFRRLVIGCAWACLSGLAGSTRGGWRCLLWRHSMHGAGGYLFEFGIIGIYAIRCNCKEYYNFYYSFRFQFRLGAAVDLYGALSIHDESHLKNM